MWTINGNARTVCVVIAAVNEAATVGRVITEIRQLGIVDEIILVDDGSTDDTPAIAEKYGCKVLRNEARIGQTRSLRRGINSSETDLVITVDADTDHLPSDIPKLLNAMGKNQADVVIGHRSKLPRASEKIMSAIVSRATGISDTISGFRLISRKALDLVGFDDDDTWGSLFLIRCAKKGLRLAEVPIETPPPRQVTRTGGKLRSNMRILKALYKDLLCMAGIL